MQDGEVFSKGLEEPKHGGDGPSPVHVLVVVGAIFALALLALQCGGCAGAATAAQADCVALYAGADSAEAYAAADRVCLDGGVP